MTRYLIRHNLKEERLTMAHALRVQSVMAAKVKAREAVRLSDHGPESRKKTDVSWD